MFYTGRFANQDEILMLRGDADGVFRGRDGKVSKFPRLPRRVLHRDDETWVHESDDTTTRLEEECNYSEHNPRMRTLGAGYVNSHRDLHDTLWHDNVAQPSARRYRQREENGLHVVTAITDYGEITWWIDSKRDWSPVRVRLEQEGGIFLESRSTLKCYDGVWFPETTLFFRSGYKDGREPVETVRVHSARFNAPEHPKRFTPRDIGVEAGMMVEKVDTYQCSEILTFDGETAVTDQEFLRRLEAGEIKYGPTFLRSIARDKARAARGSRPEAPAPDAAGRVVTVATSSVMKTLLNVLESEWEAYTRQFILRYALEDAQTQRAALILAQCQALGRRHLARHKSEIDKLDAEFEKLVAGKDGKKREALDRRRGELMKPLERIFEQRLKPKLNQLPTRAQHAAVEDDSAPPSSP